MPASGSKERAPAGMLATGRVTYSPDRAGTYAKALRHGRHLEQAAPDPRSDAHPRQKGIGPAGGRAKLSSESRRILHKTVKKSTEQLEETFQRDRSDVEIPTPAGGAARTTARYFSRIPWRRRIASRWYTAMASASERDRRAHLRLPSLLQGPGRRGCAPGHAEQRHESSAIRYRNSPPRDRRRRAYLGHIRR